MGVQIQNDRTAVSHTRVHGPRTRPVNTGSVYRATELAWPSNEDGGGSQRQPHPTAAAGEVRRSYTLLRERHVKTQRRNRIRSAGTRFQYRRRSRKSGFKTPGWEHKSRAAALRTDWGLSAQMMRAALNSRP